MFIRHLTCLAVGFCACATAADLPLARSEQLVAGSLTQDQAVALALVSQPQLAAGTAAVQALRENAVAAGELPDPRLSFGLQSLPLDTLNFTSIDMTQAMLGVSQTLPGGDKRALNRSRVTREADLGNADLAVTRRRIEREVRLAWLDLWLPTQAIGWLHRIGGEYEAKIEWGEVAYRAGKLGRDEILQWRALRETVRDRESELRLARARAQLQRWLGKSAQDEPAPDLPPPADLGGNPADLIERHPELLREQRSVELARADVALAQEAYKPDWNLSLAYGARGGGRPDLVSFQVDVDLPVFSAKRQDRRLAARLAEVNQAAEQQEDKHRMLRADLDTALAERQLATERMRRFDQDILPLQDSAEAAALAEYRSGKGAWSRVLDARRELLETRLQWLAQRAAGARADVQLRYLIGGGHE